MPDITNADLISEQELLDATGIDHHSLRRVRKWLFIKPVRSFPGRGSVSYYPKIAVPMIRRFSELRHETLKINDCVWRLWIEGFPIPIREWALGRLRPFETAIAVAASGDIEKIRKDTIPASSTKPARTNPAYPIHGRLGSNAAYSMLHWAFDIMAGLTPAKSLHDPASPSFDAVKKAGGLTGENWDPPDLELDIESLSVSRLCEIVRGVGAAELEQARRDWAMIAQLIDVSGATDWRGVRKALHVERTSSAQPIAPVDFLIALWHDPDARAGLLAGLIHFRRSPDHSHRISEVLALAGFALARFPRHDADKLVEPDRSISALAADEPAERGE
jgi:hypothetical protein